MIDAAVTVRLLALDRHRTAGRRGRGGLDDPSHPEPSNTAADEPKADPEPLRPRKPRVGLERFRDRVRNVTEERADPSVDSAKPEGARDSSADDARGAPRKHRKDRGDERTNSDAAK